MDENKTVELARLLKKAQAGDKTSLHLLCKELEKYIRDYFWHKFQDANIVDDLSQETYIRFLDSLTNIRENTKLISYVTKVAFHVTQNYFRDKYSKQEEQLETHYNNEQDKREGQIKSENADGNNGDIILDKIDLQEALKQLPEKSRSIITMRSSGYTFKEIAQEHGLTVSGVKMHFKRSLEQLKYSLFFL